MIGGSKVESDLAKLEEEGGNIVVGTPGRLEDLLLGKTVGATQQQNKLVSGLRSLEILILDEADRLLSLGFHQALTTILGFCPKQRRTGLFSATQTSEVSNLVRAGLRNPVVITVRDSGREERTPASLENYFMICEPSLSLATLVQWLKERPKQKVLSIHGQMKKKRKKIFSQFRNLDSGMLLCTDVMARGVDIPEVNWVLQLHPPSNAESFVHRCGRTARIGNRGAAVLLLAPSEETYIDFLGLNQGVKLTKVDSPE